MSKAAILIDGSYFLKRLSSVQKGVDTENVEEVVSALRRLVASHLTHLRESNYDKTPEYYPVGIYNNFYRCFFYDASPLTKRLHAPISGRAVDLSENREFRFRQNLLGALRKERSLALRLGEVKQKGKAWWAMTLEAQEALVAKKKQVNDLTDDDFSLNIHQKGVDMRLGIDITSLTLKKQVDVIVLVTGDADFVPAAKLARREGVKIILDPLWQGVGQDLYEHIDELYSGFPNPQRP